MIINAYKMILKIENYLPLVNKINRRCVFFGCTGFLLKKIEINPKNWGFMGEKKHNIVCF